MRNNRGRKITETSPVARIVGAVLGQRDHECNCGSVMTERACTLMYPPTPN